MLVLAALVPGHLAGVRRRRWAGVMALGLVWGTPVSAQHLLVPMDLGQRDHLKAYGLAFRSLSLGIDVEWTLNYRGGAFLMPSLPTLIADARLRGVTVESLDPAGASALRARIAEGNMDIVLLEKAPEIAVYTPPNKNPWDDAVTLALSYAEIPYATVWDDELLAGEGDRYDWLHLHHEDFTGQLGKFYATHRTATWYREASERNRDAAARLGLASTPALKRRVAVAIRSYVERGGFLFAMCSATETLDVALAALGVDMVARPFDGTPADPLANEKLDFSGCLAFRGFRAELDPMVNSISNIDVEQVNNSALRQDTRDFRLFEFAAKYDPVASMLVQNHVANIGGFYGQTTSFRRGLVRESVVVLGEVPGTDRVRYLHGNKGLGTFTFLGGHDPEDAQHVIHDQPTALELHPNSPGYRLILNNVLFPAARKKDLET